MKEIGYTLLVIFILGLIIVPIHFIEQDRIDAKKEAETKKEEYPLLDYVKDSIGLNGVVTMNSFYSRGYKSHHIELSNGTKFALWGGTINYLYEPFGLSYFLQVNDSIYKPTHTDSVYVYRDGKEYYFILGKIINKRE
ncbi:hypothetical protein [Viscerimonas tarda]